MATLRNKTGSEGVIVLWKPYPDHGRPSTYQVTDRAVSLFGNLGFKVPNSGDEVDIPWDICRPLRVLGDLHFKSETQGEVEIEDIGNVGEDYAQDLSEEQRQHLKEYISSHRNYQGVDGQLSDEMRSMSFGDSTTNNPNKIDTSTIQEGDKLTAKIDRVNSSGNGIIDTIQSHINIGPVKQGAEGEEVEIEMVTDIFAICITEEIRGENYEKEFWKVAPDDFHKYGMEAIDSTIFCGNCGSVVLDKSYPENGWHCEVCDDILFRLSSDTYKQTSESSGRVGLPEVGDKMKNVSITTDSQGNICLNKNSKIKISGDVNLSKNVDILVEVEREGYVVATISNVLSENDSEEESLNDLRKRAREAASDSVDTTINTSNSETTQYSRSQEVKEYVKARADGNCEGCGESAPFTSKTGEPYLHAHHIQELSDGGSDTPDTVIALCPNCHYQVHHGESGDKYNQELSNIVKEKENNKV